MIVGTRNLSDENPKQILFDWIQHNAYFFHPEKLLLAMICDDSHIIRKLGWTLILKARNYMPHKAYVQCLGKVEK